MQTVMGYQRQENKNTNPFIMIERNEVFVTDEIKLTWIGPSCILIQIYRYLKREKGRVIYVYLFLSFDFKINACRLTYWQNNACVACDIGSYLESDHKDRMVNQMGTPTPLPMDHLPSAIKSEPDLIHHTIVVHIGHTLYNIL